jgi:hypothetical protein
LRFLERIISDLQRHHFPSQNPSHRCRVYPVFIKKDDQLMEDNKISQFIQALKFFDLELEEITGQPGYEGRNKVISKE